jgi:hypothetical protein
MNSIDVFKNNGYLIIKNAVNDELKDFITQYALFDEMQNFSPEKIIAEEHSQVPNAHSKYADPAMEAMLLKLQDVLEKSTSLKLYPTYSYYRVYRPGDELKIHKDRHACEISCTVCFNYSYDDAEFEWPIYIDGNKIVLKPGDLAIYRGCDLDHWREKFIYDKQDESVWQVQGFFHYVDANGPHEHRKYDNRETIGLTKESKFWKENDYMRYNISMNSSKPYVIYEDSKL